MRNLTYTLSPHSRSLRSLTPSKRGVKGRLTDLKSASIALTREASYVDGLIFVLSGSTEEPDNTNGSKSNHQHKEAFWRQVEMRNLTYTLSPHSRSLRSLTPSKKGVKGASRILT